jgi:hypothetical protein
MRASSYAEEIEMKRAGFCPACRALMAHGGVAAVR